MKFIQMNAKNYEVQLDLNETNTTFIKFRMFNKNAAVKKA